MRKIEVYNRWDTFLCSLKNTKTMFGKIPCPECGGTGVWDYYPSGYKHTDGDMVCVDCKGTGFMFIDLY